MADDKTYNGWTNYETWCVALWIGNEESSHRYWRAAAQECWDGAEADRSLTRLDCAAFALADRLKDELSESNPLTESASVWSDLLGAALSEVAWREIALAWLDDVDQTEEEEEEEPAEQEAD